MRKSIYFLGSKEIGYECLKLLINFSKKGDFQIKKVFTNDRNIYPKSPLISKLCDTNNISYEKSFSGMILKYDLQSSAFIFLS